MQIGIVGAHGQIARLLGRQAVASGDEVRGLVRREEQQDDLRTDGVTPVLLDLETAPQAALEETLAGMDAIVFAAGAGPGSGIARKDTVDRAGSDRCVDAAERVGVPQLLQVSSMGAGAPPQDNDVFSHYLRAKGAAEEHLRASALDWLILRPGRLTNEPGTGEVELAEHVARGAIPREDVAALILALLRRPALSRRTLEVVGGIDPIPSALDRLSA